MALGYIGQVSHTFTNSHSDILSLFGENLMRKVLQLVSVKKMLTESMKHLKGRDPEVNI